MDSKPSKQIKSSRAIPIDSQNFADVFGSMESGSIYSIPEDQRGKILPPDYPGRTTCEVAGSGLAPGHYAVEHIFRATTEDGDEFHKVYRQEFKKELDGRIFRRDVTHNYSSSTNGQVNAHYQSPQDTKDYLGNWPGFENL